MADEIILGVDSRVGSAGLGQYAKWADRLPRYEYTNNPMRAVAWLHRQCRGDWILRLDGDEVPSPRRWRRCLSSLPGATCCSTGFQRWLFPDLNSWLNDLPWFPTTRSVWSTMTVRFGSKESLTLAYETLPARYLEAPLDHLAC